MSCTIKFFIRLVFSFIVATNFSNVHANTQPDALLLTQADEQYLKGNFAQACDLYEQVVQKTPSVYFNIGNCAYSMKKFGHALLNWRRAESDWGLMNRRILLEKITEVQQKTASKNQQVGRDVHYSSAVIKTFTSLKRSFFSIVKFIRLLHLQILVLSLWIVLFVCLRTLRKRKQKMLTCLLFSLLAISASMLALKHSLQHKQQLVVLHNKSPLYSGPGRNFAVIGHLPEAQEADILKESGDFYRVRINKHMGWIEKQFAEKI